MPYQNCTILENSCLDKLIRIENPCEATQPTKHNGTVFFPNKLVPEFTWQNAAKVTSEFAKGYDFAVNLKNAVLDSIAMDIRQMLLENKFEFTVADTAKANVQTVDVTTCQSTPIVTGGQVYRGVSIMLRQLNGTLKTILINRISLFSKTQYTGFTFYLNCYNYTTGSVTLRTFICDLEVGENNLLELADLGNTYIEEGVSRIDIFYDNSIFTDICNTAQGRMIASSCGCNAGSYTAYAKDNKCIDMYEILGTTTAAKNFTQKSTSQINNNAYGFVVEATCYCSIDNLLCHVAVTDPNVLKQLILCKFGQLFCEQLSVTSRMNCFVLLKQEEYKERAAIYESKYNQAYNTMLKTSKSYFQKIDPSCLKCVENIKVSSNF